MQGVVGEAHVPRFPGSGYQVGGEIFPSGAAQHRAFKSRNGEVDDGVEVEVVTAYGAVDDVLSEREYGQIGEDAAEFWSDVGQCTQGGFQVAQVGDQIVLALVD
jgi:hypothetical protein